MRVLLSVMAFLSLLVNNNLMKLRVFKGSHQLCRTAAGQQHEVDAAASWCWDGIVNQV
jgi:hypothetical protein